MGDLTINLRKQIWQQISLLTISLIELQFTQVLRQTCDHQRSKKRANIRRKRQAQKKPNFHPRIFFDSVTLFRLRKRASIYVHYFEKQRQANITLTCHNETAQKQRKYIFMITNRVNNIFYMVQLIQIKSQELHSYLHPLVCM